MNLRWMLNRLRSADASELRHRVVEAARTQVLRAGFGRARPGHPGNGRGRPWLEPLPTEFAGAQYRDAADAVLEGSFRIFALGGIRGCFPPQWNRDPKSGVTAPLSYGRSIDYRDESLVGNIKYLWEPNRHLDLVTLAQAWHLTRDDKYARGCCALLESWFDQCPYPLGPNWSSSLELGIRLVNWSFAWHLLGGDECPLFDESGGDQFKARWLDSIFRHCHFISRFPSLYSSANNHLLGELLGLFVASTTWPRWPECGEWRARACEQFCCEALKQNAPDGVNREQALWYHHEVTDMLLIAALVARANEIEFSRAYWHRLEMMLEFIASVMDVGGNVPAIGDSDDATIVRFCPSQEFAAFRSLLATGAVIFKRSDFKAKACRFDDKSRWLLGDAAAMEFDQLPATPSKVLPRRAFPEGGYYVLGADFESPREVRITADAGPVGYLSIAAHGHADALAFTLSVAGIEVLIDSGTFAYHTEKLWRDYFRGTSAHNTIRVDRVDQSEAGGNFMWLRHARVTCEAFDVSGRRQVLKAFHDGYTRLRDPVIHRRELTFDEDSGVLQVDDHVVASGEHMVEMFWHISDRCRVEVDGKLVRVEGGNVTVEFSGPVGSVCRVARGEGTPPLAWVSRRFDSKVPCTTIVVSVTTAGSWHGVSTFKIAVLERDTDAA